MDAFSFFTARVYVLDFGLTTCKSNAYDRQMIENNIHSSESSRPPTPRKGIDQGPLFFSIRFPLWLKVGFGACMFIAIAVVVRRAIALLRPSTGIAPPQLADLDRWFASHSVLTWIHILCALAFVLVLPFLFRARMVPSALLRAFFFLGIITGITAYGMSRYAVGGWTERSAVFFFDSLFLFSLAKVWQFSKQPARLFQQRLWMIRATAILLGIATTRPVMGFFFATQRLSHLTPSQFFGIAFWIGFSINTIVIEFWVRKVTGQTVRA